MRPLSVYSFHGHIAKQVQLWHLEWTSLSEIRKKATIYFKHSDLHSNQPRLNTMGSLFQPNVPPSIHDGPH